MYPREQPAPQSRKAPKRKSWAPEIEKIMQAVYGKKSAIITIKPEPQKVNNISVKSIDPSSDPKIIMNPSSELKYSCSSCSSCFRYKYEINDHLLTHPTADKPHFCSICFKKFKYLSFLKYHVQNVHNIVEEEEEEEEQVQPPELVNIEVSEPPILGLAPKKSNLITVKYIPSSNDPSKNVTSTSSTPSPSQSSTSSFRKDIQKHLQASQKNNEKKDAAYLQEFLKFTKEEPKETSSPYKGLKIEKFYGSLKCTLCEGFFVSSEALLRHFKEQCRR